MKFSDIKFGLYSFVAGAASLIVYTSNNYKAYKLYNEVYNDINETGGDIDAFLISGTLKYPLIFASVGVLFGILAFLNRSNLKIAGFIISAIALTFSFFPLWMKFITN